MPIYMDRHDIPPGIRAEHVAEMHQQDLKVQHIYGCKGMTYWCDEDTKTAFCLIEAPNIKALQDMHDHAHGDIPHSIVEVNENRLLIPQHVNEMRKLPVMIIESIIVGRDFVSVWQIGCVVFHKPH